MKKISTLIIIVLSIVLIFVFGYVGYGSTMINPDNEQSIINVLSIKVIQSIFLQQRSMAIDFLFYIPTL